MSNDLISRKEAIETVKRIIQAGLPEEAIYAVLEEIPAAYDVDTVSEKIKDIGQKLCESTDCPEECENCEHRAMMSAIDRVLRNGGKKE